MQKTILAILFTCLLSLVAPRANAADTDSVKVYNLQDVEVISHMKEHGTMRQQPAAVSVLNQQSILDNHITSLKGVSGIVPNLFIPDYGSRLTSAVYIRGIGSRINTPAVGLYVDNIPFADKSGFDFNFYDIDRIDVMRGPQGTLYGRNTMGGVIKVFTRNPLYYQGTTANLGFSTRDNRRRVSLMHYHKPSNKFAFSAGGYYEGSDGFFKNDITGKKVDALQAGGGKIRGFWLPTQKLTFDFNVGYDYSNEGAYPYYYTGTADPTGHPEQYADYIGKITNNHESRYRRGMLNVGVGVNYRARKFVMNSVTSYQNLNDRMFMDQDFMAVDIYTIEQKQNLNTLTEELTFRNTNPSTGSGQVLKWERVSGINIMKQWLHTTGPVTFYSDGLRWLESNINSNMPDVSKIQALGMMGFQSMSVNFRGDNLVMGGTFDTPTFNAAAFHQSTYHFGDHFSATVGLRVDYERNNIKYDAPATVLYGFKMVNPAPLLNVDLQNLQADITEYQGTMHTDYLKILPKFAVKWDFNRENNVYITVSKGMRSGGYNVQGFSEMLQGAMKVKMMDGIKTGITDYLTNLKKTYTKMPDYVIALVQKAMDENMPKFEMPDVSEVEYRPEYSWNYELGTHLTLADRRLKLDAAVYYIHTNDQQVARFVNSGMGRILVNAGKSESYGGELSAMWQMTNRLAFTGNYGFTHAKFTDYDGGNGEDYSGNYVPFVPMHTVNADLAYTLPLKENTFWKSLTFGLNYNGAGRLYWTEANDASQSFYGTLGARVNLATKLFNLQLWAKNITDTKYNTLYIVSVNRGYEQHGKPFQLGVDLKFEF